MAIVPTVETSTFETDLEALQADYNTAVGDGSIDKTRDTYEELAQEFGTTIEALDSARIEREAAAGKRAADLLAKAREDGLLADSEDPETWRTLKD
jgi:hypothetical protein